MRWVHGVLLFLLAGGAVAQTSTVDVNAAGTPQPVPALVAEDLAKSSGRAVVTITPDTITTSSQHFLRASQWGFWLWQDELHMHFYTSAGERRLIRIDEDVEGVMIPAGQPTTFEYNWSPAGIGVFVEGELRAYLEGDYVEPSAPVYGAAPNGNSPYNGGIKIEMFAEPRVYDPCTNYPNWGMVASWDAAGVNQGNVLIPQPACQTVPDPDTDPAIVVDGTATTTFSFTVPTENEDGSALLLADIKDFRLFWGDVSRVGRCAPPTDQLDSSCYPNMMAVQKSSTTTQPVVTSISEDTTLYFSMITTVDGEDAQGNPKTLVSDWSNEVARAFVVDVEEPPPPDPTPTPTPPEVTEVTIELSCTTNVPEVTCTIRQIEP